MFVISYVASTTPVFLVFLPVALFFRSLFLVPTLRSYDSFAFFPMYIRVAAAAASSYSYSGF